MPDLVACPNAGLHVRILKVFKVTVCCAAYIRLYCIFFGKICLPYYRAYRFKVLVVMKYLLFETESKLSGNLKAIS